MKLYELIAALVQYGIDTGLTPACERIYTTNLLLDQFHEDDLQAFYPKRARPFLDSLRKTRSAAS